MGLTDVTVTIKETINSKERYEADFLVDTGSTDCMASTKELRKCLDKIELRERIIEIIKKYLTCPHFKIFFFGSRTRGNFSQRSDIDIGIEAYQSIPLEQLTEIKMDLDELPILQKIDVVDFKNVTPEFKDIALQNIEVIYEN